LQVTINESQISDLTHYTDSDVLDYLNQIEVVSGSIVTELPSGLISGSQQISDLGFITSTTTIPDGTVSSSQQVTDYLPENIISSSQQISDLGFITDAGTIPDGTVSSSIQVKDYLPEGTISSSQQVISLLPQDIVSGSQQVKDYLPEGVVSGSQQVTDFGFIDELPQNLISSSAQITNLGFISFAPPIPDGTISGSQQITDFGFISESITSLPDNLISSSQQISDFGFISSLPVDLISSSNQLISLLPTGIVSSSQQVADYLPENLISGSQQIIDFGFISSGTVSSVITSAYVKDRLPEGTISSSNQLPTYLSEAEFTTVSQSLSTRVTTIEFSGLVSGSSQIDYENIQNQLQFEGGDGIIVSQSIEAVNILLDSVSYNNLSNVPQNIISGSEQIAALNFVNDSDLNSPDGIKTLTLPDNTTISSFAQTFLDDTDAESVRTTLGIPTDFAVTDSSNTFEGNQVINADLNVTGSITTQGLLQPAEFTDAETGSLSPSSGAIIWNSTRNKLQVFVLAAWIDLH
jgi:hypothetical protein